MVPLCVDLDGTLVRTDTLYESLLRAVRRNPAVVLRIPVWLFQGRAHLKHELARRGALAVDRLPYRQDLLDYLHGQKEAGRKIVLATAADSDIAEAVASHTGCFDEVVASRPGDNLKGAAKRARLESLYGHKGFDYAGDSACDGPVWGAAREAILAGSSRKARQALAETGTPVAHAFPGPGPQPGAIVRALRLHQWSKNLLLFTALFVSHNLSDPSRMLAVVAAFFAFGYVASAIYIVNDLLDLESDRLHPTKRFRPFASSELSIPSGLVFTVWLLVSGLSLGAVVSPAFAFSLVVYAGTATVYSLYLKRLPMVDVLMLASLYTLRVLAGGAAAGIRLSPWLLGFSIFMFFSLALVKRASEIKLMAHGGRLDTNGRGYRHGEDTLLSIMGVSSGYLATLVLALYINSPEVSLLYSRPEFLWPACPLVLTWISRVWLITHRGEMPDDPIVFALRDGASYLLLVCLAVLMGAAAWVR